MESIKMVPINDYVALKMEVDRLTDLVTELTGKLSKVSVHQQSNQKVEKGIVISSGGTGRYVKVSDIVMIKAESNYSTLYLTDGSTLFTSKTLKYWLEKCNAPFLQRIHKSYVINSRKILSFEPAKAKLFLEGGFTASYSESGRKLITGLR